MHAHRLLFRAVRAMYWPEPLDSHVLWLLSHPLPHLLRSQHMSPHLLLPLPLHLHPQLHFHLHLHLYLSQMHCLLLLLIRNRGVGVGPPPTWSGPLAA